MRKTRNKEAHNALLRQYIKEIENPDRHGFIGGKWVQSPYKGDDPNNRGYGIDVLQNKDAAKLTQGRQGKWLTEDEERMLRNKHIKGVNKIAKDHFFPYLRKTPLSEEKEIMATGLLYRGDHINGTKLAEPYYNGSNADFQKAVEDYYRSKNLNDRAWRSKEFMDTHKSQSPFFTISLESPYVPIEYVGYHPNEDYYYAGELPQVDAYGEYAYAEGGMLYGNQDAMPSTPQEEYQQEEQENTQETPRQWDDLSLSEKNAFIANAVQHGITNMEDIRNAYNELMQEQLNGNDSMDDMEDSHKFLKGGYKPSRYIKNFISHMEGASMKTNRSFDAEAKDFWNALPNNVKGKITQEQADALYSYSYNVGAGNFKNRVVPALERYFSGNGSVEDVQRHMYATKDNQLRGLTKRRAQERAMFAESEVPVYYNEDYTPQSTNSQWRNNRLGPVTAKSFNISQGLGPVSNTSNTLGPVTSSDYMAQRNKENTEALANILYGSQPMTAFDAPQETTQETSGIDRYNEIQDLLSTPYTFANGGEKDSGVTSTNGLYHASPSEYTGILDSVANNNPLEVTLPDTTVTASDPSNYRSYYDPNGFMDFANIVTLGLPNRGSMSQDLRLAKDAYDALRGRKTWGDVVNSAIMGNKGVFNNPYANLALDFAVPMAGYGVSKASHLATNIRDYININRFIERYGYNEYKPKLGLIFNDEKLDKLTNQLVKQHNTFTRGVSTYEARKYYGFPDSWSDEQIARYTLTHPHRPSILNSGGNPDRTPVLYTSNSIDLSKLYTDKGGYVGILQRPIIYKPNRSEMLAANDFHFKKQPENRLSATTDEPYVYSKGVGHLKKERIKGGIAIRRRGKVITKYKPVSPTFLDAQANAGANVIANHLPDDINFRHYLFYGNPDEQLLELKGLFPYSKPAGSASLDYQTYSIGFTKKKALGGKL